MRTDGSLLSYFYFRKGVYDEKRVMVSPNDYWLSNFLAANFVEYVRESFDP